jgi:outer membrane protein TolC
VVWRIFDAGRIRSNILVQTAREEQALASYESQALTAFEDVENALTAYAKEQVRNRSLQVSVNAQRTALRLSQDLYQHGLADFLRVLDSARSLYQAEDGLAQSQNSVLVDLIALYKALGGGWEIGGSAPPDTTQTSGR